MRLHEIISPTDLFGVIGNPALVSLDKLYTSVEFVSSNFYIPMQMLSEFQRLEMSTEFANIASSINYDTLDPNWKEKYNQLVNYFNS